MSFIFNTMVKKVLCVVVAGMLCLVFAAQRGEAGNSLCRNNEAQIKNLAQQLQAIGKDMSNTAYDSRNCLHEATLEMGTNSSPSTVIKFVQPCIQMYERLLAIQKQEIRLIREGWFYIRESIKNDCAIGDVDLFRLGTAQETILFLEGRLEKLEEIKAWE